MSSLCDTGALDEAIRACSSFNSAQDVRTQMINDLNAFGSDTFLSNYCGINLRNRDDGAITGLDAGNGIEKTNESVIPENGSLDTGFTSDSFTVNGLTFQLNGMTFYRLDDDKKFIWQSLKTWWAKGALDLIEESYGSYFNFSGMTMWVSFEDASTFAGWGSSVAGAASTGNTDGNCFLYINEDRYKQMNFSNPNGTSKVTNNELDRLIAHEFTHAIMGAKGVYLNGLPQFITEGLAELTRGIDHQYATTIRTLAGNSNTLLENLNFNPGTSNWASYAAGYMFLRYLAQQGATNHKAPALFDNEDNNQQNTTSGKSLKALAGNDTVGNWGNNVTLNTGSGNDSVFNDQQGYHSVIDTGEGDDTIWSWGAHSTLNVGDGNDSISNNVLNVTMNGGFGNDTLINWNDAAEVKMSGDDGADYLQNHGYNVTIEGGAGNDLVYNEGNSTFINAGSGNDSVRNWQGTYLEIELGDGEDTVANAVGHNTTINTGDGNDYIDNTASNYVSIYAGYGNDFVWNWEGNSTKVELGEGNDSITNWHGSSATINGGGGDDFIHNNDVNYSSIDAGSGNDIIRNESSQRVTVSGGTGNDMISIDGSSSYTMIKYAHGDGDDWIYGYNSGDTISIGGGYYTRATVGSNVVVNVIGSGAMTLVGASDKDVYITGGTFSVPTTFTEGNDYYYSDSASNTVLSALGGNDTIIGRYWYSSISGGAGNDVIDISSGDVDRATINGGYGNDTIYFDNYDGRNLYQYASGDGADVIYYLNAADTIHVTNGTVSSAYASGNDVIIQVGSGSITLKDKKDSPFYLKTGSGSAVQTQVGGRYISNSDSNTVINGTSYADTIYNSANTVKAYLGAGDDSISQNGRGDYITVDGGTGNDTIRGRYWYSSISGGAGNDVIDISSGDVDRATINGGTGNDTIYLDNRDGYNYVQYVSGDGDDTVYGIRANDTLKITGSSYTKATVGNDLKISVGNGSILLKDALNISFTIDGTLTGNNTISNTVISGTSGRDSIHLATANYVTVYANDGADTITGNYYNSKIYSGSGNDSISVVDEDFYRLSDSHLVLVSKYLKIPGYPDNLTNTIDGGDGNDTINIIGFSPSYINGGNGNDRISIAGENGFLPGRTIKGGKGDDIIYGIGDISLVGDAQGYQGFSESGTHYEYSYGDGSDTIYNYHSTDVISIVGNSPYTTLMSGNNIVISVIGSGAMTLYNAKNIKLNIEGGMPTIPSVFTDGNNYYVNSTSNTLLSALGGNDTIVNSAVRVTINGDAGADKIISTNSSVAANGGAGNDYLEIEGYYNTISGGDGNDSIYNSGRSTSIHGGSGDDSIVNGNGLYITINGGSGNDTIANYSNYHLMVWRLTAETAMIMFTPMVMTPR